MLWKKEKGSWQEWYFLLYGRWKMWSKSLLLVAELWSPLVRSVVYSSFFFPCAFFSSFVSFLHYPCRRPFRDSIRGLRAGGVRRTDKLAAAEKGSLRIIVKVVRPIVCLICQIGVGKCVLIKTQIFFLVSLWKKWILWWKVTLWKDPMNH